MNVITISRYLELFRERKRELLSKKKSLISDELFSDSQEESQFTSVYITWDITMVAIKSKSLLAINWLSVCSCLSSNNIPHFLFDQFAKTSAFAKIYNPKSEIYEEALGTLNAYSMLAVDKNNQCSSIHNLVQDVIRLKCKPEEKANNFIAIFLLFIGSVGHGDEWKDIDKKRRLLPHLESFMSHLGDWEKEEPKEVTKVKTEKGKSFLEDIIVLLATWHRILGNSKREKSLLERVLLIKQNNRNRDNTEMAITLMNLGNAYGSLGDYEKQREYLERAMKIQEAHYGPDHLELARTIMNLGRAYGYLGDNEKEREFLERAMKTFEKHSPGHPELAGTLVNLSNVYGSLGDYKKQREFLEQAMKIYEREYGSDHPQMAVIFGNLGNVCRSLGNREKQRDFLEQAMKITERHYGQDHPQVASILWNLSDVYFSFGDYQKQRESLERAMKIKEKHYGPDHPEVAKTLECLGTAYGLLEDYKKMSEFLKRALLIYEKNNGLGQQNVTEISSIREMLRTLGNEPELNHKEFEKKQMFSCPSIGLESSLPIDQLISQIRDFIQRKFCENLVLMSSLIIRNCNLSSIDSAVRQQVDESLRTLDKVLSNLLTENLEEREKFKRLRKSKIEQKIGHIEGCIEFLCSIGFHDDESGEWFVFNGDHSQISHYMDVLLTAEQFPIVLEG